jgi:hypothetical protein
MPRAAKMMDVVVSGRMAKMKIVVRHPATESAMKRTGEMIAEAMRLTGEAEFNTQSRSMYRNALIN